MDLDRILARVARFRLRFDAETEARFVAYYDRGSVEHARWASAVVFLAFLLTAWWPGLLPEVMSEAFLLFGCTSAAAGFVASFVPRVERVFQPVASLILSVPLGSLMVMIMDADELPAALFGGLLVFQVFSICSLCRLRTRWATAATLVYLAIVLGSAAELDTGVTVLATLGLGSFSVGMVATWAMERNARTEWVLLNQTEVSRTETEALLQTILPTDVAHRLKRDEEVTDRHDDVSVLFADLVGFTRFASENSSARVIEILNDIYSRFDRLAVKHGIEKIKTIGDNYMAASGLPEPRPDHADAICAFALDMMAELGEASAAFGVELQLRAGVNSGPVVAGVIGEAKPAYDIWGDTVNVASRMESLSAPGQVTLSEATHRALSPAFRCESGGVRPVKGKGMMPVYVLQGRASA